MLLLESWVKDSRIIKEEEHHAIDTTNGIIRED